jgi:hypothetical protein
MTVSLRRIRWCRVGLWRQTIPVDHVPVLPGFLGKNQLEAGAV